ncbi:hypothetical protein BC936DRAFT_148395 [Jimgerdemannia flammicorona]|uniref:Uncharacterized protein n=1 Tax=Jimgerdemannia flammicorona TaxID=994334 RepID=A0A433D360_9FUNG|nr:hypothetical protein BC936DRAFT_148395 [Jimgerdemannia flammicorona]
MLQGIEGLPDCGQSMHLCFPIRPLERIDISPILPTHHTSKLTPSDRSDPRPICEPVPRAKAAHLGDERHRP